MPSVKESFSLYVHLPYCVRKCPYCDFNSHVVPVIPEKKYTESLIQELDFYAERDAWRGRSLKTVFFGGGTPSLFSPASIDQILRKATSLFPFETNPEITLEANPGTVESAHFSGYRSCGVNRISLGVQSFQPGLLKALGRVHTVEETRNALRIIQQTGFANFSIDLIYAVPGQSRSDLEEDLREALSFGPPHFSAYNLTIEEGTPFHHDYVSGRLRPLPEDEEIAMAEVVEERLAAEGLGRYEISNYAKPGFHSRHNVTYWQGGDYLGIGAGAHSYHQTGIDGVCGERWHNERQPGRYMEAIRDRRAPIAGEEKIDPRGSAGEFLFLGLRMLAGVSTEEFSRRFDQEVTDCYPRIGDWISGGLMEKSGERLRLTRRGLLLANSIFVDLV